MAHAASQDKHLHGLMDSKFGLVQTVADNFDANIASPNGLKATHSLALLATQVQENVNDVQKPSSIKRLHRDENTDPALAKEIQQYYNWKSYSFECAAAGKKSSTIGNDRC